ncbi:hypothetical protein MTBSS4_220074 [Magnetospirillum sp. SS-4]|nr:hypothetical protein MTBSS4_220074 [Magnetospirillum sp. SS-4]
MMALDERLHPDDAVVERRDRPDRNAGRKGAAGGGGDHAVANRNGGAAGDVVEAGPRGVVAGEDGLGAGGLQQDRSAGVDVGDQQQPRRAHPHFGDVADQNLARQHGLPLANAVLGAGAEQHGMAEGRPHVADHPGGDEGAARIWNRVQVVVQNHVLGLKAARHRLPMHQAGVFLAQAGVLGADIGQFVKILGDAGDGGGGPGHGVQHGGQGVADQGAGPLDQHDIGLAEDHQGDRGDDQRQEGEALDQQPDRREPTCRTRLLHRFPPLPRPPRTVGRIQVWTLLHLVGAMPEQASARLHFPTVFDSARGPGYTISIKGRTAACATPDHIG